MTRRSWPRFDETTPLGFGPDGRSFAARVRHAEQQSVVLDGTAAGMMVLQHGPFGIEALRPRALFGADLGRGLAWLGGGAVLLYFVALAHLPAGVATLLNYSSPIFTIVFSALFLREPMTLRSIIAILIAAAGVYLTARGKEAGGEFLIVARRAHDDSHAAALDADFERFFTRGDIVHASGSACGIDFEHSHLGDRWMGGVHHVASMKSAGRMPAGT